MPSLFCYVNTLISYQEHVDETISRFYPPRINCASCSLLMLVAAFFGQGIFFYPMLANASTVPGAGDRSVRDAHSAMVVTGRQVLTGEVVGQDWIVPAGSELVLNGPVYFRADAQGRPSRLMVTGHVSGTGDLYIQAGSQYIKQSAVQESLLGNIIVEGTGAALITQAGAEVVVASGHTLIFRNSGSLTLQGGTLVLEANSILTYESTAGLPTVNAGSTFKLDSNAEVKLLRTVNLAGGTTCSSANTTNCIRFQKLGSNAWYRVLVQGTGTTLDYVYVDGATSGVWLDAANTIVDHSVLTNNGTAVSMRNVKSGYVFRNSYISNSTTRGILVLTGASVTITANTITASTNEGIQVQDAGSNATLTSNTITGSTKAGVRIKTGSTATLTGNTITGNALNLTDAGVVVQDAGSNATIGDATTSNTISSNSGSGISVVNGASASIQKNTVASNGRHGLYVWDASVGTFKTNTLESNSWNGILIGGISPVYTDEVILENEGKNTIRNNSQHEVSLNNPSSRFYAGDVGGTTCPGTTGTGQGKNNIYDAVNGFNQPPSYYRYIYSKALEVDEVWPVEAECNYWGQTTPDAQMFYAFLGDLTGLDAADYDPWLSTFQTGPEAETVQETDIADWLARQQRRMAEVAEQLRQHPADSRAGKASRVLYYLALEVKRRSEATGTLVSPGLERALRDADALLVWFRAQALTKTSATTSDTLTVGEEVALLLEVEDLIRTGQEASALTQAAAYLPLLSYRDSQAELHSLSAIAHTHLGAWAEALAALAAVEALQPIPELELYYTPPDHEPIKAWLNDQLNGEE
jgi:parallel beta-helix repeat protein